MKVFFVNIFLCVTLFLNSQTTYNLDWGLESTNQQITIDVGDTVIWTWSLGFHNLRSTSGVESFDSGYASSGFVFSHTFTTAGITEYVCDVHALAMYGTVIVSSGIVPDYFNDFSTFPGDSWTEAQGSPDVGPSGTTSSWVPDGFGNNGTTGAAKVNIYSTGRDEWLISPDFDLSAMPYYLNLDAAATEYASTVDAIWASDDYAALLVTTDGGATWTELYRWDGNNNPGVQGAAMPEIELTGYTTAKFGIYAESTVSNEDIDFFVDNFRITQQPLADAPDAVTNMIPNDGAINIEILSNNNTPPSKIITFQWTAATTGGIATSFTISLGTDDEASNIGSITFATSPASISYGLVGSTDGWMPNTTYYWKVTAINSEGQADSPIYSFATVSDDTLDCNYSLRMLDSHGDGWNGNTIDVLVDGVVVLDNVTLVGGAEEIVTFSVTTGADVTTNWNGGGSWATELSYEIYDTDDSLVGTGNSTTNILSGSITAACPNCTTPMFTTSPADITVECDASTLPAATGTAVATDNCDNNVTITYADTTVAGFGNNSVITRVWTATDDNSNASTYTQTITVVDTTAPTFTTSPADVTIECNASSLPANTGQAAASDNCDGDVTVAYADTTVAGIGNNSVITRVWTATDDNSNATTYTQTITVTQNVVINCSSYCDSFPSSVDGQGITEIILGSTTLSSAGDVTYEDFTSQIVDVNSASTINLQITLATGYTYDTNVWIDLNNDFVFDNNTELVFSGATLNANPTTLDASFNLPPGTQGVYNMRIGTADYGQSTPDPCYNGSWGVTADLIINVNSTDTTAPVITLLGNETESLTIGDTYIDAGATASDNIDGDLTDNIVVVSDVDTSVAGSYTVTYNVSDSAGNPAAEVIRTVSVELVPITDDNIHQAVYDCLSTNPIDGMCLDSQYGPMPDWDVSAVTYMGSLFAGSSFNGDISQWDVSNVLGMSYMFSHSQFSGDISLWDVSSVINMEGMFKSSLFNGDIGQWDVSNVIVMNSLFEDSSFNGDISLWDVSSVFNMGNMFNGSLFNGDISQWHISNVTAMYNMFQNSQYNGDISQWDVSAVTNMTSMFHNSQFNGDISQWDVSAVTHMGSMFQGSSFNGDISQWDVSSVINMSSMFYNSQFNGNISQWYISNVTYMINMLTGSALSTPNYDALLNSWSGQDTQSNISLGALGLMYCNAYLSRQNLIDNRGWNIEDSGVDIEAGCTIPLTDSNIHNAVDSCLSTNPIDGMCLDSQYGPMPDWDVSNVTNMNYLFYNSQFNGDISQWDVSNVTVMYNMFQNSQYNGDISQWDVSAVTNMSSMFFNSQFNGDISQWDISSAINMNYMFYNSQFNGDISQWDVSNVTNMINMLTDSALSIINYDALLNGWSQLTLQQGVYFGASPTKYCNGADARQNIIDNYGWIINDGGVDILFCRKCLKVDDDDVYLEIDNNVTVSFYSNVDIRGFQFDITFPAGFEFNSSDINKLELPSSFIVTASNVGDNTFRVVGFSLSNENIPSGEWPILSFPVLIDSSLPTGNYTVPISELILSDINNENVTNFCDDDGVLTLYDNPMGDATGDHIINVIDILATIDYIFGNNPNPFIFDFADVNFDDIISILDILGIQDIILAPGSRTGNNAQDQVDSSIVLGNNYLIVEDKQLSPNSTDIIEIKLVNQDIVKGLQFDFSLPEGISLNANEINATTRLDGFILSAQEIGVNIFRVLAFSLSGGIIDIGSDTIINLPVTIESEITDGVYPVAFTDVTISDVNNEDVSTTAPDVGELTVGTLGNDELNNELFNIYPNPTTGIVNIQGNIDGQLVVVLYNILGQEILKSTNQSRIDMSRFESGVFVLKVSDGTKSSTFKIIKK